LQCLFFISIASDRFAVFPSGQSSSTFSSSTDAASSLTVNGSERHRRAALLVLHERVADARVSVAKIEDALRRHHWHQRSAGSVDAKAIAAIQSKYREEQSKLERLVAPCSSRARCNHRSVNRNLLMCPNCFDIADDHELL
jgi:hypothetical protein